jgi:hypothetical protein
MTDMVEFVCITRKHLIHDGYGWICVYYQKTQALIHDGYGWICVYYQKTQVLIHDGYGWICVY